MGFTNGMTAGPSLPRRGDHRDLRAVKCSCRVMIGALACLDEAEGERVDARLLSLVGARRIRWEAIEHLKAANGPKLYSFT